MKAFLFDLDGTLIDSADDIALALEKTLKEIGLSDRMPSDIRKLIGNGARALLEEILGDEFREEFVSLFKEFYMRDPVRYTKTYEGIDTVLKELKGRGKRLAVITNKLEDLSKEILRRTGLIDYFDFIAGGDTFPEKKPSPLPVFKSLEILGIDPEESVMIGDTDADMEAGKGAGTKTALAGWGYVRLNSLEPDFYLNSPTELLSLA